MYHWYSSIIQVRIIRAVLKAIIVAIIALILAFVISALYKESLSLGKAMIGILFIGAIEIGVIRLIGINLRSSATLMVITILFSLVSSLDNNLPDLFVYGETIGIPRETLRWLTILHGSENYLGWIKFLTSIIILLAVGWKWGFLSLVLLCFFGRLLEMPIEIVLTNASIIESGKVMGHNWIQTALNNAPWTIDNLYCLLVFSLIGAIPHLILRLSNTSQI